MKNWKQKTIKLDEGCYSNRFWKYKLEEINNWKSKFKKVN